MEQVLTHRARLKTYPFNRIWKRAKARSDTSIPAKYSISNLPCLQSSCDLNGSSTSEQRAAQLRMLWAGSGRIKRSSLKCLGPSLAFSTQGKMRAPLRVTDENFVRL